MGLWSDIKQAVQDAEDAKNIRSSNPRDLTEYDRAGWADAQDAREAAVTPRTVNSAQRLIRQRNPVKYRRLEKDFKWLQKEMVRIGLNPEDARYIL